MKMPVTKMLLGISAAIAMLIAAESVQAGRPAFHDRQDNEPEQRRRGHKKDNDGG